MDTRLLEQLPANDPYRRVFEDRFEPQSLSSEEYRVVRPALVDVLTADMEHRPCTPSMRSARLGRFMPFLVWCLRQGYPALPSKAFDADVIECFIAQSPEAASTKDAVYQLRSALVPLCAHFGNPGEAAQKVLRTGARSHPAVPLASASRLLRIADSLRNPQARVDARIVLSLAHGCGFEARHVVKVCGDEVSRSADGSVWVTSCGREVLVHEPYAQTLLGIAASARASLLGSRTDVVPSTVERLNEALAAGGYDLKVDVAALRAGWKAGE